MVAPLVRVTMAQDRTGDGLQAVGEAYFTWLAIKDGLMMNDAQFEPLIAGLDERRVRAIEAKDPQAVE